MPHSVSASASAFPDPSNREALVASAREALLLARNWRRRNGSFARAMYVYWTRSASKACRLAAARGAS